MKRFLVVANETLMSEELSSQIHRLCDDAEGRCAFHLVVPATHPHGSWTEGQVRAAAAKRLEAAIAQMEQAEYVVTGEVGDGSPYQAVGDALLAGRYDSVVISTLPARVSRWLKQDLVHRVQRAHPGLEVMHVVSTRIPQEATS